MRYRRSGSVGRGMHRRSRVHAGAGHPGLVTTGPTPVAIAHRDRGAGSDANAGADADRCADSDTGAQP